jgi:hypothetical protein
MVADVTGDSIFELRKLVEGRPKNCVGNVVKDLERTDLIAAAGILCVLVDMDQIAKHVGMPTGSSPSTVAAALRERSDAKEKLSVHFLDRNLEGLMHAIANCGGEPVPTSKDLNERDVYLKKVAFADGAEGRGLRDCVKGLQPSLGGLVDCLVERCRSAA